MEKIRTFGAISLAALILAFYVGLVQAEEFQHWKTYKTTKLYAKDKGKIYFFSTSHMAVDADGAPNAYHPQNLGLDSLANAGYPDKDWWDSVLVADPKDPNKAYIQPNGPYAGYFVSKTSLQDKSKAATDPSRYVNAATVPYLVFPGNFYNEKGTGRTGDLGIAVNLATNQSTPFVVADVGPKDAELGEVSIKLAESLGGKNVNPRNGKGIPKGNFLYVVFPFSSQTYKWPLDSKELSKATDDLIATYGGLEAIQAAATGK